ncbi:MAG: hypothetical protein CO141_00555 [Candidatus Moranbacteria bacterium CG_4_9_14_3_um_filter_42_9]|nr:MAG: hypothetical protein CO141_00555 [Candidatus Moranbacteria bacterium CG_4_9_14_3_um_filter_42_9]
MKKNELVIDEKSSIELRNYYWDMLKLVKKYEKEFPRAYQESRERGGANFSVFGKTTTLDIMMDSLIFFIEKRPPNWQAELMFLLHEKENLGDIKMILEGLEKFLQKLPGVKLPESRPKIMDDLLNIT